MMYSHPIKWLLQHLDQAMQRSLITSQGQFPSVGLAILFGLPFFYWMWTVWFPQPQSVFILCLIGSGLGLGLLCAPYWPSGLKQGLSGYWFFTLLYTLPFFFAYVFFINQAHVTFAMSLLCSVFILVLLVDLLSLSILLILGWSLAFFAYYLTVKSIYLGEDHIEMGLVLLFVTIVGSTVGYKSAILQQQRMAGMAAAAGMIAHELRTPLLGIKSGAQALVNYMPILFEGYTLAKQHQLLSTTIRENRIYQLKTVTERIMSEIHYANIMIDMLLVKAGRENYLQNCVMEPCSMQTCLIEAMERYPFQTTKERHLITWSGDFQFNGSKLLMQHVLFNLFKNALYAIATAQRGDICIWVSQCERFHYLHVKDTAKGMSNEQLSRLFDHFYTTTFMGTGIGLSFCKLVMNRFGGDIRCEAREGEYAHFILSFPMG